MGDQVVTVDELLRRQRGSILRGRSARATVLTGEAAQQFYERVSRVYGVGRSAIPVGTPISLADIEQPTIPSIPSMVKRPVRVTTEQVPVVPLSSGRQPAAPNQAVVPTQPIKKETTMDLGSIITNLGGQYIQARYGQPAPAAPSLRPVMQVPVGMGVDTYGITPTPAFLPALPGAVAGVGSLAGKIGGAVAGLGLGLAADEIAMIAGVASKVKCKRRRRRLATHSDIKDLAALKAVLGSGKAFDTWIATRRV